MVEQIGWGGQYRGKVRPLCEQYRGKVTLQFPKVEMTDNLFKKVSDKEEKDINRERLIISYTTLVRGNLKG